MKTAIITLTIGDAYKRMFRKWFAPGWHAYAKCHGIDIVVIEEPIDTSMLAAHRSSAWQKCILHRDAKVREYDQIAWVDADVRINPKSPNIFENCPLDKVSAVDAYGIPSRKEHDVILSRLYAKWDDSGNKYIRNLTPMEFHDQFGLKCSHDHVVQTGVMVFSPDISEHLFEKVYKNYDDRGHASWNYEMRPLSYEILESGLVNWLNPRFNISWSEYELYYYPFLSGYPRLGLAVLNMLSLDRIHPRRDCVHAAFRNSFFLHFAGGSRDYRLINPLKEIAS